MREPYTCETISHRRNTAPDVKGHPMTVKTRTQVVQDALAPEFDWDALPELEIPEYTRGPKNRIANIEETTPAAIKAKVRASYDAYKPAGHDPASPNKTVASWMIQKFPTVTMANEFVKLAKRYGKNTDPAMTVRTTIDPDAPTVVRFMAKPQEVRASKIDAAIAAAGTLVSK